MKHNYFIIAILNVVIAIAVNITCHAQARIAVAMEQIKDAGLNNELFMLYASQAVGAEWVYDNLVLRIKDTDHYNDSTVGHVKDVWFFLYNDGTLEFDKDPNNIGVDEQFKADLKKITNFIETNNLPFFNNLPEFSDKTLDDVINKYICTLYSKYIYTNRDQMPIENQKIKAECLEFGIQFAGSLYLFINWYNEEGKFLPKEEQISIFEEALKSRLDYTYPAKSTLDFGITNESFYLSRDELMEKYIQ